LTCFVYAHFKKCSFILILLSSFCLAMASLRQCTRCGFEHEPSLGEKCKRALQALPETQAIDTVRDDAGDQATDGVEDHVSSMVSVISQLVTRLDSQQEQLNHLQAAMANASPGTSRRHSWRLVKVKVPYQNGLAHRRLCQCQSTTSLCRI
jgi:hypothetical protein